MRFHYFFIYIILFFSPFIFSKNKPKNDLMSNFADTNYQIKVHSGSSETFVLLKYNKTYEVKKLSSYSKGSLKEKDYKYLRNNFELALKSDSENINNCSNGFVELFKIQKKETLRKTYCLQSNSPISSAGDKILQIALLL